MSNCVFMSGQIIGKTKFQIEKTDMIFLFFWLSELHFLKIRQIKVNNWLKIVVRKV